MTPAAAILPSLLGAATGVPPPPDAQVVDLVVARVNDATVTLSELVAETGLVLLRARGPEVANEAALSRELLASVLDAVVNEVLLFQEVRRLQLAEVSEAQIREVYRRDLERFEGPEQRASFGSVYGFEPAGPDEPPPLWATIIRRGIAVESFLSARSRLETRPSPAMVLRCYEANAERFAGRAFADAEPAIRRQIDAQLRQRTAERLVDDLRRRAQIRISGGFERARAADAPEEEAGLWCPLGDGDG